MPKSKTPRKKSSPGVQKKPTKGSIMKDLERLDTECQKMLAETAKFSPYLTNRDLVAAGDYEQINNNASILSKDTIQLRNELDDIRKQIPKKLDPNKTDDVMKGLQLGEQYSSWQESYERAVLPTIQRLGELFKKAAENLNGKSSSESPEAQVAEKETKDD